MENAWHQVDELGNDLIEICNRHPEGVHLLGYSQGGLLARAILEVNGNHNVKNFISLSSPQAGQFGSKEHFQMICHKIANIGANVADVFLFQLHFYT